MEVDEIQRQVCKFQRISSNGSTISNNNNSSNPHKIASASNKSDLDLQNRQYPDEDDGGLGGGGGGGGGVNVAGGGSGGVARLCGWPSSRIVRVSRASGGKDRHSKVLTSKGLRDRRVRLSVTTAIQFYDLQDRLGYDQPSKAVEWLLKAASSSIAELPSLDPAFQGATDYHNHHHHHHHRQQQLRDEKKSSCGINSEFEDPNYENCHQHQQNNNNNVSVSKSSACSSTSETSKGSGLSLSRSENRIKARERAREMAAKKEKEKESESTRVAATVVNQVNSISQNSSFTDLLTGGISSSTVSPNNNPNPTASPESRTHWTTPMEYFFNRPSSQSSPQIIQMPQFNITTGDHHHQNHHHHQQQQHFSFLQESFVPVVTVAGGGGGGGSGGESYNLNFSIASSSRGGLAPGFNRGTLQSNLPSLLPHHHHHHHFHQRFQSPSMDHGSTSSNLPFFLPPNTAPDHFPTGFDPQRLQLCYGGAGEGGGVRHSDHHQKEKSKN